METQSVLNRLKEIRAFFKVLHEEYDKAFWDDDLLGMVKTSGELSVAYSILGNMPLSRKWSEEHRINLRRFKLERKQSC